MDLRPVVSCVLVVAMACDGARAPRESNPIVDDFADTVRTGAAAARIVSLGPVTTEVFFALGAGDRGLVGPHDMGPLSRGGARGHRCGEWHTAQRRGCPRRPSRSCGAICEQLNRSAARQLRSAGVATLAIRTDHVSDFRRAVTMLARAIHDSAAGARLADSVENSIRAVQARPKPVVSPSVFWFIWESPLYTIGRGSFMSELVDAAGARNVFADLDAVSPQVTREEVVRRNPDFVLTGPENADRLRANPAWQAVPACARREDSRRGHRARGAPGAETGAGRPASACLDPCTTHCRDRAMKRP